MSLSHYTLNSFRMVADSRCLCDLSMFTSVCTSYWAYFRGTDCCEELDHVEYWH